MRKSEKKGARELALDEAGTTAGREGAEVLAEGCGAAAGCSCVEKAGCGGECRGACSEKKGAALDERKLARMAGVRRRHIVRWRQSLGARNEDWTTVGALVALTPAGARRALRDIGVKVDWKRAEREALAEGGGAGVSVRVFRMPANARLVLAQRIDRSEMVSVRVRDNSAFRVGDEFEAFDDGAGQLEHRGSWPDAGW